MLLFGKTKRRKPINHFFETGAVKNGKTGFAFFCLANERNKALYPALLLFLLTGFVFIF